MVFYLNNEDKILLFTTNEEVIFVHYCGVKENPTVTDLRWKKKNIFEQAHMLYILKYMTSDNTGDRNIGLKMLEQTLKIVINGEIVGYVEG